MDYISPCLFFYPYFISPVEDLVMLKIIRPLMYENVIVFFSPSHSNKNREREKEKVPKIHHALLI